MRLSYKETGLQALAASAPSGWSCPWPCGGGPLLQRPTCRGGAFPEMLGAFIGYINIWHILACKSMVSNFYIRLNPLSFVAFMLHFSSRTRCHLLLSQLVLNLDKRSETVFFILAFRIKILLLAFCSCFLFCFSREITSTIWAVCAHLYGISLIAWLDLISYKL